MSNITYQNSVINELFIVPNVLLVTLMDKQANYCLTFGSAFQTCRVQLGPPVKLVTWAVQEL